MKVLQEIILQPYGLLFLYSPGLMLHYPIVCQEDGSWNNISLHRCLYCVAQGRQPNMWDAITGLCPGLIGGFFGEKLKLGGRDMERSGLQGARFDRSIHLLLATPPNREKNAALYNYNYVNHFYGHKRPRKSFSSLKKILMLSMLSCNFSWFILVQMSSHIRLNT